jgi:uncharacterized membrane protein
VERGRVEAFSDGVFAVAITLLVLNLRVPTPNGGSIVHQLLKQWPEFAAYLISFMVIGIIWVNHHTLLNKLRQVDRVMLFLNLLLLLFVVFIPYPTAIMADYLKVGGWDAKVSVAFYSAVMFGMSIAFSEMYLWAGRHEELLDEGVDAAEYRGRFWQFAAGLPIYVVLIGVSFISAELAVACLFAVALFYVFDPTAARRAM